MFVARCLVPIAVTLLLVSTAASAHPRDVAEAGLAAGLAHPFGGLDHLVAMLLIGFWGATSDPRRSWLALFVAMLALAAGFMLAGLGAALPLSEAGIVGSLVILVGLSLFGVQLPRFIALMLIGAIGVLHGYVHGIELPADAPPFFFAAGMVGGSVVLMGFGIAVRRTLRLSASGLSGARGR